MADSSLPFDPVFEALLEQELNMFLGTEVTGGNMVANNLPSPSQVPYPPRPEWNDFLPEPEMAQTITSVPQAPAPAPAPARPRAKSTGAETIVAKATAPAPAGVSKKIRAPRPARAPASAPPSLPTSIPADEVGLTEENYLPKLEESLIPPAEAKVRSSHYGAYFGKFKTSEEARGHRRHSRLGAKKAADTQRVKKFGRTFWVRRIYEAMVDVSEISDRATSIHRQRLEMSQVFDPLDLEAAAHQVFDAALKVHESGWCHPLVYHKNVVRGKLVDRAADSLELRLSLICELLRTKKAMVDDAIRGGITLALLVDNPTARGCTKSSNDAGNEKKGHRLKVAKELETMESPEEQAEEGEEEGPEAQA